jgi:dUTPase
VTIPDATGGVQRFYIKDVPPCVQEWCVQTGELQGDFYIFMVRVRTDIPRDLAGMLNEKIHKAKQTVRVGPGQQKCHMPSLGEKRHGTIITKAHVSNDVLINLELLDKTRVSLKQAHLQMWVQVKRTTLLLLEDNSDNALLDYVKSLVKNFSYMAEFVNRRIYFERINGVNWDEIEEFRRKRQIDMQDEARKGQSKGLGKGKGKAKGKPEDVPTHAEYQSDDTKEFYGYHLYPRSSISKTKVRLANSVGIIDPNYRGYLIAAVDNISDEVQVLKQGERYFQLVFVRIDRPSNIEIIKDLSNTDRGANGFGSTGK